MDTPTMLRIDRELQKQLRIQALVRGTTQRQLLEKIVADWLQQQDVIHRRLEVARQ